MPRNFRDSFLVCAFFSIFSSAHGQTPSAVPTVPTTPSPAPTDPLVQKIQGEIGAADFPAETKPDPAIPHGEFLKGIITNSAIYPGTANDFQVYIPAQYDPAKPACLLVKLDGLDAFQGNVLDSLIAKKEVPVIIGVGVTSGVIWKDPVGTPKRAAYRFNRSYEFDSTNANLSDYVLNEVLPAVEKLKTKDGRPIRISPDGSDHAVTGGSTGGIGSFTLAWERPDQFTRVYSIIGTFVSMRGGHDYPALIRKTDPKPIRIFLEDGSTDAWNPLFGSWFEENQKMESALSFAGYDVAHAWGVHGHSGHAGGVIFPDVMRWLWRDYPAPIKAGGSHNGTLQEITLPGEAWQKIPQAFQSAAGLAANAKGEVFLSDAGAGTLYRLGADDKPVVFLEHQPGVTGEAFGPDGTLYGVVAGEKKIIAIPPSGPATVAAEGIAGHSIVVTHEGAIYVSEPGEHTDMPSQIWQIKAGGEKKVIDQGLSAATGIAFAPDGSLFYAGEHSTKWIYSYLVQPDGSLVDKQRYFWLHTSDIPDNSGVEDLAVDTHGNLYAATDMGIQVCDQNGRVRAILSLPTPCGPVRSLCFGGPQFDVLYATDGTQLFKRKLKIPGFAPWAAPIVVQSHGGA
jgi:gluconolactonase